MLRSNHRYVAEVSSTAGVSLGTLALAPDWEPAAQWSYFRGMRRGEHAPLARFGDAQILPNWDEKLGEPYVDGVDISFAPDGAASQTCALAKERIPNGYFQQPVETAAAGLVSAGKIKAGEKFTYRICGYNDANTFGDSNTAAEAKSVNANARHLDLDVEDLSQPLPLESSDLSAARTEATKRGHDALWQSDDMPIFIRQPVLDEAAETARVAGDRETGGILIGRLYRDTNTPEIFTSVTAQILAQHTLADHASLTFTSESSSSSSTCSIPFWSPLLTSFLVRT